MSEPIMAGLTLLAWGIGMGVFLVLLKYCGGCRKAKCDVRAKPYSANGTGAQMNTDITQKQPPTSAPGDSPNTHLP
jgi:hypothetical protein